MIYVFTCWSDKKGCGHSFEVVASMDEASTLKPTCPSCRKRKPISRDYGSENVAGFMIAQTIGSIAENNAARLSEDEKTHLHNKHNEYKDKPFTGKLPEGGSLIPRDHKGKKLATTKQRRRDDKKKK